MRIVAIGGVPGVGKSTLMQAVLAPWSGAVRQKYGLLEYTACADPLVHVLGYYEPGQVFGGTDRLSMAVHPDAVAYLRAQADALEPPAVLFEGDRLFTTSFLEACRACADLTVVELYAAPAIVEERRAARAAATGKAQDATWLRGRLTKVATVLKWAEAYRVQRVRVAVDVSTDGPERVRRLVLGV